MNKYISDQFKRIGLYIYDNAPVNEYPDFVKLKLHHVNGESNWLSLSDAQLKAIYKILESDN
jgi:hypothetical protein